MGTAQLEQQRYYVLEQLTQAVHGITAGADVLERSRKLLDSTIQKNMDKARELYAGMEKERLALLEHIQTARRNLLELGEDQAAVYAGALHAQVAAFPLMTPSYTQFAAVLKDFAGKLPTQETATAAVIARLMNNVKLGYYPTDLENVGHILRGITFPEGVTANLIDPCCGEGHALAKLAQGHDCATYGIELDEARAEAAQDRLHRVGVGSYFYSRVSRSAFHALFLNPPYLSVLREGGLRTRDERRFLIDSFPRLAMGGLLIYIIPYYRLTGDICRILCDNFTDLSVHRFTDEEFKKHSQIVVMGLRREQTDGCERAQAMEAAACDPTALPCVTELEEGRYPLPDKPLKVEIFKGAQFNKLELERQLCASDSFDKLLAKSTLDTAVRQPPLPLSIAQIGLIGGSGLINGLVDCESPHIIKGRIIKAQSETQEPFLDEEGELLYTEKRVTTFNKMVFGVLTPKGYRSLT